MNKTHVWRAGAAVLAFLLVTAAGSLLAQGSTGAIGGTVIDSAGASLPGASVKVKNLGTGLARATVSGPGGTFTFPLLPVGRYEVEAEILGFSPSKVTGVTVSVGGKVDLTLKLIISATSSVLVTSETPLVETTRTQSSSVVNETFIANLPTNGRNFIEFALTTPGVSKDTRQGDISFAGQRGTLNSLVIDGANNDNTFFGQALGRTGSGRAPYQFSQDAVKEFQVNRNAYTAEYGRAGGAVINVVTKSGTNEYHGSAFEFYRDKSLNANDYIFQINGRPKGNYHYNQFGASLGGPVVKDRLFFFANYDGQRNINGQAVILNTSEVLKNPSPETLSGLAKLYPLADPYDRGQNQDVLLLKADYEAGSTGHFSARYNRQRFTGVNNENGGTTQSVQHSGDSLVQTDTLTASLTSSFSQNLFNEIRGQYAKDSEPGRANSADPEALIQQGAFSFTIGRNNFSPRETTITRYQVADAATFLLGAHAVKGGFDWSRDLILNWFPGNFSGSYTFNTVADYDLGKPKSYTQAFPGPGTSGPYTNPDLSEIAFFLQDEWHASSALTLNLGVRYDKQGIGQPTVRNPDAQLAAAGIDTSVVPLDNNNVAARAGFAWTPKGSDKTVVRGGYGMFYGRTPSIMIGTAMSNNGINVQTLTFGLGQMPVYPNIFPAIPSGVTLPKPTIFAFDPSFQSPLVHQASVGIEHAVASEISVGLSYLWAKGTHLQRSTDINLGSPSIVNATDASGNVYPITRYGTDQPFSNFKRVIQFQSTADSEYNGATLEINKRFSSNWQARLAYTYSKVIDTKPDATSVVPNGGDDAKQVSDPRNFLADRSVGDADQRHRVVLSGYWSLPFFRGAGGFKQAVLGGWSLSGIVTVASGQPYSPTLGPLNDLNGDGNNRNDRAPGFARNSLNYPTIFTVDPRVTKDIPAGPLTIQLIAEAFNIFNRSNVVGVTQTYYSVSGAVLAPTLKPVPAFGTPTASAGPRIVQLAAKILF